MFNTGDLCDDETGLDDTYMDKRLDFKTVAP
jgi:hypothetical protein